MRDEKLAANRKQESAKGIRSFARKILWQVAGEVRNN